MFERYRLENVFAIACALVRFAVCCYRAAHQAIIVDEATTYNQFVSGPWRKLFGRYDANNHILSSVLVKLTVTLCGLSPLKLRLVSVVSGFLLVLGAFWLLKQVDSWVLRWTAYAAICLCPLLLDFSIAARGYSLSLALFVWALYFCRQRRYLRAGFLLGFSLGANLTIAVPMFALILISILFERKILFRLIVPALMIATMINGPSLRRSHREDFYIGYPGFRTAAISFVATSLYAMPDREGILGIRGFAILRIVDYGLPLFLVTVAAASFRIKDRRKLIPFLTFALTLFGLILLRWLFGINYPADRTCMYFIILGPIAWAIAADSLKWPALWALPLIVLVIQFCTQLQTRYFEFWRVEADDQIIAGLIQRESMGKADNSLTLACSWMHQPTMEFYRRYLRVSALKPVERFDPTPLTGFDFYVLSWGDFNREHPSSLKPIFTDPDIEVMLATSSAASRAGN